ncbi:MAG: hypothetical protein H0T92_06880 [Pyrinomonadaceae bacterium]|nr:hypothetical protein [Pyrinomonadaceae bacterium]
MPDSKECRKQLKLSATLVLVIVTFFGCSRSTRPTATANKTSASPTPATAFERDLDYVRKGSFMRVYTIARPDGNPLDAEDIAYLKANTHPETNYWIRTDEGRRVIAGTNFNWSTENMQALGKRFTVEDYTGR